jgi:serine/threonine protein kinase/tetratricopeptide (TPR) repeat protein
MTTESTALLFGKYKLLELIARGGMAEVFKAKSFGADGFEKVVVIKRILPELAQNHQFVEMAINEAKLAVALSHANIVQVFDLGREEDTYFIVMEYVHGMDFAEALRRSRKRGERPPVELCVYACSETARALDYAHRRRDAQLRPLNIVHRDISPQNLLLSFEGEVKVTDFGIAKARTSIEEAGTIKGKYAYMAPEQAKGQNVDARADVFALGVVLYESIVGKNPFQERTAYETLRRVQLGDKLPLDQAWPECPEELARIVDKATHPDRDQRHASAAKLYEDLAGFLYTTRKRVTAHDLAEWLERLRDDANRTSDADRVRDALEDAGRSSVRTPVEIPAASSRPGPSTSTGRGRTNLERRDATLLCADFPAHVAGMVEPLSSIATRYGGANVSSDDEHVVWLFGASATDGRDTEAAARAALKLRQSIARDPRLADVGLGLHAARIHVRLDGPPERDQWFSNALAVVRDLARAAPSKLFTSEPVGRILGDSFAMEPVRTREPGLERVPGTALALTAERSSHEGARRRFVGRKEQFRTLGDLFARAAKHGVHAIAVTGEPGAGKTRFLEEVEYRLRRMNHPVSWYSTTCLPSDREVPGAAVAGILRSVLAIDETDPEPTLREKATRLRELGLHADELAAASRVLGITGGSEPPGGGARPLRSALMRLAASLARDQLTVLMWDGAEHMDDDSQALVDELVRGAGRARLVVVVANRSGFVYAWKDAPSVAEIALNSLTDEETRSLVALRLNVAETSLPRELVEEVAAKSSGNPLFIEEHLRSLVDAGAVEVRENVVAFRRTVAEVEVPKTLRGLVSAELARLAQPQRTLLQVASVLGPRWSRDLLAESAAQPLSLLDETLRSLVERGALVRSGDEFAFAHEMRREVVYDSLALEARRELHATVAAVVERMYPDRLDELSERLALHYRECNDRSKAVHFLERAARRRAAERAFAAAAVHFARAVELAQAAPRPDPEHVLGLYTQLAEVAVEGSHAPSIDRLRLGLQYAEELGDRAATQRLLLLLGRLLFVVNRFGEAIAHLERSRAMLDRDRDQRKLFDVTSTIGQVFARNGEFGRAQGLLDEAVALVTRDGDSRALGTALLALARCQGSAGETAVAEQTLERARGVAERLGDPVLRTDALKTSALIWYHARDFERAAVESERALEMAREFNLPYEIAVNAHNAGDAWMRLGDYRKAFTNLRISQDVALEHGFDKLLNVNDTVLAFVDAVGFGSEEARGRIESTLVYADAHGYKWDALHARFLLGVLSRERGEIEQARTQLREALVLAQELDNHLYIEDCQRLLREMTSVPPPPVVKKGPPPPPRRS